MASTGEVWKLGHRPALDGVRGVAVLLVVACHVSQLGGTFAFAAGGPVGVTAFFTLSGFLITALLLEERERSGRIDLAAFYLRRARRLAPALLVLVAFVAACALVLGSSVVTFDGLAATLLYVGNWSLAEGGSLGVLGHTWSLAIEEQFYLVWPLVVIVSLRRASERALLAVALGGVVVSTALRLALWNDAAGAGRVYFGSDTRADALLVGCALAVVLRQSSPMRVRPQVATALVVAMSAMGLVLAEFGPARYLLLPTLTAVMTAGVIVCVAGGDYRGWLTAGPWRWLGRRSYGLYLWNLPVTVLAERAGLPLLVGVVASFVAAELSWRYVETPFLRRSVRRVEPVECEPNQGVVLPGERLDLGGNLRVRW